MPGETDPELAHSMVMQDGTWFLPDRGMAEFTGENAGHTNERARDNGMTLVGANRSQLIDIKHDISNLQTRKGGKDNQLYDRNVSTSITWPPKQA
jgi:hypothetical protein